MSQSIQKTKQMIRCFNIKHSLNSIKPNLHIENSSTKRKPLMRTPNNVVREDR